MTGVKLYTFYSCILGIVQPVFTTENDFLSQCFVDGGLAANFPLHAFDGKNYLSIRLSNVKLYADIC